jgi:hypothetical protein
MFAGAAIGMLALDAAFAVVVFVIVTKHPVPQGPSYRVNASRPDLTALSAAYVGLTVATAVCWIGWQRLAHRTLVQRGVLGLRNSPISVLWWLVPIANLIAGPRAVHEIGRHVPAARWASAGMRDLLIRVWWLLFALFWLGAGQGTWEVSLGSWGFQVPLTRSSMVMWGIDAILAAMVVATIEPGLDAVLPWISPADASSASSMPRRLGRRLAHRHTAS